MHGQSATLGLLLLLTAFTTADTGGTRQTPGESPGESSGRA